MRIPEPGVQAAAALKANASILPSSMFQKAAGSLGNPQLEVCSKVIYISGCRRGEGWVVLQGPTCHGSVTNRRNEMQPPPRAPGWPSWQECEACLQVWVLPYHTGWGSTQEGAPCSASPDSCGLVLPWRIPSKQTRPAQFKARDIKCRLLGVIVEILFWDNQRQEREITFPWVLYQPFLCLLIFSVRKSMFSYTNTPHRKDKVSVLSSGENKTKQRILR